MKKSIFIAMIITVLGAATALAEPPKSVDCRGLAGDKDKNLTEQQAPAQPADAKKDVQATVPK